MITTLPDPETLLSAYARGYFPMPEPQTQEILWFAPDPRAILPLDGFHVSRSLARTLKRADYEIRINHDFIAVMQACADRPDTWINDDFIHTYNQLHQLGYAHCIEVWQEDELSGGVYGVAIGGAFFAESKFHSKRDASKIALYHLVEHLKRHRYQLLEIQFLTPHLQSLGAIELPLELYLTRLREAIMAPTSFIFT